MMDYDKIEKMVTTKHCVDISNDGNFLVLSNNQLVWIIDFETKEITNKKRYPGAYIIRSITIDNKYALFTSAGETQINILSLPDLNEVASIPVAYVFELKFISNDEVLFYERDNANKKSYIKLWNFKTGETKEMFSYSREYDARYNGFFVGNSFILVGRKDESEPLKYRTINRDNIDTIEIKGDYLVRCFGKKKNQKIITAQCIRYSPPFKGVIGIYDIQKESFSLLKECPVSSLRWIYKDLNWFEARVDVNNSFSGIIDFDGNILWTVESMWHVENCSNSHYIICRNPFGSLVFYISDDGLYLIPKSLKIPLKPTIPFNLEQ